MQSQQPVEEEAGVVNPQEHLNIAPNGVLQGIQQQQPQLLWKQRTLSHLSEPGIGVLLCPREPRHRQPSGESEKDHGFPG
jgi:hypothetical protein